MNKVLPDLENEPFAEPLKVPLARIRFNDAEVAAVAEVVRSGYLCQGPKTAEFEAAFSALLGVRHAVAVSSGSAALLVALQALGVGPDDEVIVPNMTFISTATSAMYLGARPVFCDITLTDYGIDSAGIEALLSDRTKVIVPVHYAGQTAEMGPILDLAEKNGLRVLEDAAEAHLSRYNGGRYAGTLGDAGIFSFTPTKPMTTGEGGMIVTDSDEIAERCRVIRNFGDGNKFAWDSLGFNFRLGEMAATIGLGQIGKLEEMIAARREKAGYYDDAFADQDLIVVPPVRDPLDTNYQLYTVLLRIEEMNCGRDEIISELAARGVASRLYYPALHRMGVFGKLGPFDDEKVPNSLAFEKAALSLPIFTDLTHQEQRHVVDTVIKVLLATRKKPF